MARRRPDACRDAACCNRFGSKPFKVSKAFLWGKVIKELDCRVSVQEDSLSEHESSVEVDEKTIGGVNSVFSRADQEEFADFADHA